MTNINYRNLTIGQEIEVVTAWSETTTFEDISNGHFFKTKIEEVYFEPKGEFGYLRIFAKDGDGETRRVNYILQDGEIRSAAVAVSITALKEENEMICLNDRAEEIASAFTRGLSSKLEVFNGWEPDTFHVRNRDKGTEYEIILKGIDGKAHGHCQCGDFKNRKRICKHLACVLKEIAFSRFGNIRRVEVVK